MNKQIMISVHGTFQFFITVGADADLNEIARKAQVAMGLPSLKPVILPGLIDFRAP